MKLTTLAVLTLALTSILAADPLIGGVSASGWPLCAVPQFSQWPECQNFTPTSPHGYLLFVTADPGAARIHYSVKAVLVLTGESVTLSGDIDVNTTNTLTVIPVVFNGVIYPDPFITVSEYTLTGNASTMPEPTSSPRVTEH